MIMIALCDDNQETVDNYAQVITNIAKKHSMEISISSFFSGEGLLFHLGETPNKVDIIYLDILMGKTNGMEIAKELRKYGSEAEIIFLTSSEDYVYDAFDVGPVQYLLKETTSPETFEQVFLRAVSLATKKTGDMLIYESGGTQNIIPIKEISYIEIWKRIVMVHYAGKQTVEFYGTLEQMEEQLQNKEFVRVHRSYIVHLPYIIKFESQQMLLSTGTFIPVGVTYIKKTQQAFSDYVSRSSIFGLRRN